MTELALEKLATSEQLLSSPITRRVLVISNPHATTVSESLRNLVIYALQSRYEVEAIDTRAQGHATEIAHEASAADYDAVIAFGGDGTVNEVANGLVGTNTPLCCLPGGATNVYCRMLGIPNDIVEAAEHVLLMADRWQPRSVDLGSVNGRYFVFAAGAGIDALVVRHTDEHPYRKAKFGPYYFTQTAALTFMKRTLWRLPKLTVEVADEQLTGTTVVVQNGDPYTFFNNWPIRILEGEQLDSGTFAIAVLKRTNPLDSPTLAARLLSSKLSAAEHRSIATYPESKRMQLYSVDGRPFPLQVDGDYIGETDCASFEIHPGALSVVS